MKIIDTHSHLNFKAYNNDRDEVIRRTLKEGVVCIDVGTKYETSKRAVELAQKHENIFASIGMHPIHIKTDLLKLKLDEEGGAFAPPSEEFDAEKYRELAKSERVIAIGEIGLDYYYKPKSLGHSPLGRSPLGHSPTGEPTGEATGEPKIKQEQFKELQKKVFLQQLEMAEELNLPVIIHCRMAHNDVIDILKSKNTKGVIHCFTGNWEDAQKYINLGFYLGINGIIFKLDLNEVVKNCPLDKILVETDCPYLTPPAEGKDNRNEPIFIKHIIQKIADLKACLPAGRELSFDEVANKTTENAKKLFNI
jgi:TatD DNase family protein